MMLTQLKLKTNYSRVLMTLFAVWLVGQSVASGAVTVTPVGTPGFQFVDSHVFSGATDAFPSIFPNHFPRTVHAPPYDHEFADGLAITGLPEKEAFRVSEFTAPSAVHLGYALVPNSNGPTGSTQDYGSGLIIPNAILPITIQGDVFLNGAIYEQGAFSLSLPPIDGFDGRSHFVVENWENSDFAPPGLGSLVGDYEYRIKMRDVNSNGFDVVANFQVVPEPVSLAQFGLGTLMLAGWASRRRRLMAR